MTTNHISSNVNNYAPASTGALLNPNLQHKEGVIS